MAKGDPRTGGGNGFFPAVYQSAMGQSAKDYDSIMQQYKDLGANVSGGGNLSSSSSASSGKLNFNPINPTFVQAGPNADFGELEELSKTGGYSEGDIGNIRARAIAPIRSIYDSANRNLLRQKNLQGGYSPNYGAASAKMAREQSNLISGRTTDANAAIAEMVQKGKSAAALALAPLRAQEAARMQALNSQNAGIANNASMFNSTGQSETDRFNSTQNASAANSDFDRILATIQGQQSTYGTTPALASTFGNQVLSAANTVNNFPPVPRGSMSSGLTRYNPNSYGSNIPRFGRA